VRRLDRQLGVLAEAARRLPDPRFQPAVTHSAEQILTQRVTVGGAVDVLREIVAQLRAYWPDVEIVVRGDCGIAVPEVYDFCEAENLLYVLGFAANEVLQAEDSIVAESGPSAVRLNVGQSRVQGLTAQHLGPKNSPKNFRRRKCFCWSPAFRLLLTAL